jgi:hypothetical protein
MKTQIVAKVTCSVHYAREDHAMLSKCERVQKIEQQLVTVEIPDGLVQVARGLDWAETLKLVVEVTATDTTDLRDQGTQNPFTNNQSSNLRQTWPRRLFGV